MTALAVSSGGLDMLATLRALKPADRMGLLLQLDQRDMAQLFAASRRELGSAYGLWQDDPSGFCRVVLGDTLWSKQDAILERCVPEHVDRGSIRLAVPATHSPGKTFLGGRLVAWWESVWPIGTALAVTTAPKMRQVKFLMWPQIRAAHRRGGLYGRVDQAQWMAPELKDPLAYGFSAADADEDAVQGIHSTHLLALVDEAGGIGHTLGKAFEALTSQPHVVLVAIGNPPTDEEGSWFEERCASELWQVERISAGDTPAFTGEVTPRCTSCPPGVPPHRVAMHLTTPEWVSDVVAEFGAESRFVTARVLARFPRGGARKVVPIDWLEDATDPEHQPEVGTWVRLGVDPAADGGDELAIARTVGYRTRIVHRSSGSANARPLDVAGDVLEAIRDAEAVRAELGEARKVRVKIEVNGLGWGVAGILEGWGEEGKHAAEIVRVNVSETPNDAERYARRRDEMWWNGRKLLTPRARGGGPALHIEGETSKKVVAQLHGPTYKTDSQGRIVVQPKKELKQAGLPSPDQADAVLLSLYEPETVAAAESRSASDRRIPRPAQRQGQMVRLRPKR